MSDGKEARYVSCSVFVDALYSQPESQLMFIHGAMGSFLPSMTHLPLVLDSRICMPLGYPSFPVNEQVAISKSNIPPARQESGAKKTIAINNNLGMCGLILLFLTICLFTLSPGWPG